MKNTHKFGLLVGSLVLVVIGLVACGPKEAKNSTKNTTSESKVIRLGTSPGPYSELFIKGVQPILEKEGYQIKQTDFTDLLQADVALTEGAIDVNVDQHTAYLENFNENKDGKLTSITPIPTVPAGIFPGTKNSLADATDGDKIGIPEDPSNSARAYNLLSKAGLIVLKKDVDPFKVTAADITEYKKDVEIIQMASAQIPRSLADLSYAVIPGSIVYSAGIDSKTSLLAEDVLKKYELVATVDQKNQDSTWAKAIVDAYQSKEFKTYIAKNNQDNYWFIPEELR